MSYVIIRVDKRELVTDAKGQVRCWERRRTAEAYIKAHLTGGPPGARYRVDKTDRLPEYIENRMKEPAL